MYKLVGRTLKNKKKPITTISFTHTTLNPIRDAQLISNIYIVTTWRIIDKRVSAFRDPAKDQSLIQRLGRAIAARLKGDRRRREEEAGAEVETLLESEPTLHQEAWHRLKGWYWAVVVRAPPPALVTLKRITADRVDLYR